MSAEKERGEIVESPIGKWMAAALEDPAVCSEMKTDIEAWFAAGEPAPTYDDGFKAGIEAAARVAADVSEIVRTDEEWWDGYHGGRKDAATAIRALAQPEQGEAG